MKSINIQIIETYKRLLDMNLNIGSEGNISVKKEDIVYITPSGIDIKDLQEEDISIIDLNGLKQNNIKPSSELDLHLTIYQSRKEICSVVHCHSEWASTLSCLRTNIPQFHYMIAEFGGKDIKCAQYATMQKLAKNVLNAMEERKGVCYQIMVNYALANLDEATHLSNALEKLSKQYYFLSKKLKLLSNDEMNVVLELFSDYKSIR